MLQPGTIIANDFRIVRPLSEGGMGSVFIADQLSTGAQRALKIVRRELLHDPRLRQRFEQEARVTANIASDHVVSVVAAGIDAQTQLPWLAMELLKGQTLFDLVQQRGPIAPGDCVELFTQLCHAIAAAHAVNVVHRDLKPENIFLAESRRAGMPFFVKVLDFGIARVMAEVKVSSTEAMGTPLWMAPEQSNKGTNIGPWTDLWPLGLMAFFSLTGQHYWLSAARDDSTMGVLREILIEPIMPASQRAAQLGVGNRLPPGFDAWFAQLVERDPQRRLANVNQARDGLLGLLRGVQSVASAATVLPGPGGPSPSYPTGGRPPQPGTPSSQYGTPPGVPSPYGTPPTPYGAPPTPTPYGAPPQPPPAQGGGTMMASPAWSPYAGGGQAPAPTPHPQQQRPAPAKSGGSGGLLLGLGGVFVVLAGIVGFFAFRAYQGGKNTADCGDESQDSERRIAACRATCEKNVTDDACRLKGELLVSSGDGAKVAEGVEALKASCTSGNAKACRGAAAAGMFPPRGAPARDPKAAASLADKACTANASECAPKGVAVEYGWLQGSNTAGEIYDRGCNAGDTLACVYGASWATRHGAKANPQASTASTLLRSRCAKKDIEACAALGVSVESSAKSEAQTSYKTACDAGDALGCNNLGKLEADAGSASAASEHFKKACDSGEPAGCNNLGALATGQPIVDRSGPRGSHVYKLFCAGALSAGCSGWGEPTTLSGSKTDLAEAVTQFDRACDMGLLTACVNEGALILVGQGGPRDRTRAEGLFQRACDGGDSGGCGESATLALQDRVGAPQDDKKGFTLMKEACNGGEIDACANVAALRLLNRGDGGAKSEALATLKGYCDEKNLWCDVLGDLYATGSGGVAADPAEARRLYKKACAEGSGHTGSCPAYAAALRDGVGGPKDVATAKDVLGKACDRNDFEACTNLGFMYEDGVGVPKDTSKSMTLYQKGCDLGHAMSCNALSSLYANGVGVPADPVKAASLAREACEGAYPAGCGSYGIMLARGIGSAKDPANAKPYLEQACRQDKKEACDELGRLGYARPKN